jgi:5-deoxy-glucuronate isomerase
VGIPSGAPLNTLSPARLRLRPRADGRIAVTPRRAGWRYLSFRVDAIGPDVVYAGPRGEERAIVVLGGGGLEATAGERTFRLEGRADVFSGLPWALYLPAGIAATLRGIPGSEAGRVTIALASAPPSGRNDASGTPIVVAPDDIRVEIRGAGNATRQINHIVTPEFPADRLELVEVLTPSGNWSSWPPHKHDEDRMPDEAMLEEVYHYRFRRSAAWAIQRLYRRPERGLPPRDALWVVRDGDVVLVTDGYHPFVASHGDDAYYLNALAGDRRTMACSFDPDLDWVRATWRAMEPDPRVPLVAGSATQS